MTTGPRSSSPKVTKGGGSRKSSTKPRLHLLKQEGSCIGTGLRKIAALQLEAAIAGLEIRRADPEAVHDARTYIKKVRAIIQIASPAFPTPLRRQLIAELRAASSRIGALRDADVHLETIDDLLRQHGLADKGYSALRARLLRLAIRRRTRANSRIEKVIATLRKICAESAAWPGHLVRPEDVRKRIRRAYRQGRIGLNACEASQDPEPFHCWRKHVKRLWYQLRLTCRFWPQDAARLIRKAGEIGELAGRERDLTLMKETLCKWSSTTASRHLISVIEKEVARLRGKAIRKGRHFYRTRPAKFLENLAL